MNALQLFLLEHPIDNLTEEIDIGGRLKGQKLTIRPLTSKEHTDFTTLATANSKKRGLDSFDTARFTTLTITAALIDPPVKSEEMIKAAGVKTPEQLINKIFLPGEKDAIMVAITRLSGFNGDTEEEMEEVKNS